MNTAAEWSNQFDVLYNNITSNQAPGLNEYEKSIFLTKAQSEIIKNYFNPKSKGNQTQDGFDDSAKRQADFSGLMKTSSAEISTSADVSKIDSRSILYQLPSDMMIVINETITTTDKRFLQVIPLKYNEYTRLMSKPFKRPLKNQAWRLLNTVSAKTKVAEIVINANDSISNYQIRYVKHPNPIILADLTQDGLSINGKTEQSDCELDEILHEDILQRAVELAKIAWTATGNDNIQAEMAAGQRSE